MFREFEQVIPHEMHLSRDFYACLQVEEECSLEGARYCRMASHRVDFYINYIVRWFTSCVKLTTPQEVLYQKSSNTLTVSSTA